MRPDHSWPFLAAPDHPLLSALWEVLAHGLLSVLVVSPLLWRSPRRGRFALLAFLVGVGLDLDHAVAAKSLDPAAMEGLSRRPDTHSLLFISALACLVGAVNRRGALAWGVFAILAAHLLFDAAGGGVRWLFPLQRPEAIPWLVCPLGIVLLFGVSWALARRRAWEGPESSPPSLPDPHPIDQHAGGELGGGVR